VDQGKDGGARADSERQRQHRDEGETWTFAQLAGAEADVYKQAFQRYECPHLPAPLFQTGRVSEQAARSVTGFFGSHPGAAVFFFAHGQVKRDFVMEIAIQLRPLPKRL
jgi:hypothetical protein